MRIHHGRLSARALAIALVGCASTPGGTKTAASGGPPATLCFQDPGIVVVVLANAEEVHDVDTTAGRLVQAAGT
jgi:hypothetical protein